ncbi:MAG: iron-containing alcohol dehydrogenase [Candidatus Omnitrophica bacterium]|nr:iron-containing alcohol dehydrogenase [Candidatus Omnitrophota bacterium]
MKNDFVFRMPSKVIFGMGKFDLLPEEVSFFFTKGTVLVVMDPAIKPQVWPRVEKLLAGWKTIPCEIKPGEPTVQTVDKMADFARKEKPDLVIGIGGGSTMDTAKAIAGLITNPGSSEKYRGQNLLTRPAIPGIMVPTTAGTGSELTQTAVLIHQGRKGGINSPHLIPATAILDPALLLDLPMEPTRATGLDALTHAIESFLSKNSNPLTEPISLQAAELLIAGLPAAVSDGKDPEARTKTMLGSLLGGISLANAGVIVGHSLSYPLGARYGISHGVANGLLLPYVAAEILPFATEKLARLASAFGISQGRSAKEEAEEAIKFLFSFEKKIGFQKRLADFQVQPSDFDEMVEEAWAVAVPVANTPKPMTKEDLLRIYQAAY